jgi:hypothetical protein
VLGWPKRRKLAQASLWESSCKRVELAQLLGKLGVFLTLVQVGGAPGADALVEDLLDAHLAMNPIVTLEKTASEYDRKPGIKWLSCTATVRIGYSPTPTCFFAEVSTARRPH